MAQIGSQWRPGMVANYAANQQRPAFQSPVMPGPAGNVMGAGGMINPDPGAGMGDIGALLAALLPHLQTAITGRRGNPRVAKPSSPGVPQRIAGPISTSIPQPSKRIAVPMSGLFHHNAFAGNSGSKRAGLLAARKAHVADAQAQAAQMAGLMNKARARGYSF